MMSLGDHRLVFGIAAAGWSLVMMSQGAADSYHDCLDSRTSVITGNIIKQCKADMADIVSRKGYASDALIHEESTCETTAKDHAEAKAAAECAPLQGTSKR